MNGVWILSLLIFFLMGVTIYGFVYMVWSQSESGRATLQTKMAKKEIRKVLGAKTAFFKSLFEKLDYLKKYGTRFHIDGIMFALYKLRFCAIIEMSERDLSEQKMKDLLLQFDMALFCAADEWMEKKAPFFNERTAIMESRFNVYDKVMLEFDLPDFFIMSYLTFAFVWLVENGWIKDEFGTLSRVPNQSFDVEDIRYATENPYARISDELQFAVIEYAEEHLSTFISNLLFPIENPVHYHYKR